jgi:hypothetical protein
VEGSGSVKAATSCLDLSSKKTRAYLAFFL